jgi:hypothetical protein
MGSPVDLQEAVRRLVARARGFNRDAIGMPPGIRVTKRRYRDRDIDLARQLKAGYGGSIPMRAAIARIGGRNG